MSTIDNLVILTVVLLLQPWTATSSFWSPIFRDACKEENMCGKGNCRASNESNFGFVCECEDGWKQARSDNDTDFKFLPCVIPNCTINSSCGRVPAPAPESAKRTNQSIFDPCYWTDCGGGTCNKTSLFRHRCECQDGYYNLLNVTIFPCFRECSIGTDCSKLGFDVLNRSSPSSSPDVANDQGSSLAYRDEVGWVIIVGTTLAALVMVK